MSESVLRRFDKLMEHPVVCTSGMAFSLFKNWEKQAQWDESLSFNFDKLKRNYPDFFSNEEMAKGNLSKIANIEKIQEPVCEVRTKKEEIQKAKKEDFLRVKNKGIDDCKSELLKILKENEKKLQEGDLEKIQKEKDAIMQTKDRGSKILDIDYLDGVERLELDLQKFFHANLQTFFNKAEMGSKNAESEEKESYKVSTRTWNPFTWFNDDETRYRTYKTIKIGDVVSCTQEMIDNLRAMCRIGVKDEVLKWREYNSNKITQALRSEVGDKFLDIPMLDRMTKRITDAIQYPEISLPEFPQELRGSGKLEGWQAEEHIKKFNDFFTTTDSLLIKLYRIILSS